MKKERRCMVGFVGRNHTVYGKDEGNKAMYADSMTRTDAESIRRRAIEACPPRTKVIIYELVPVDDGGGA